MGIINSILSFIVKKFWPWFLSYVWPFIKEHVKEFVYFIIETLKEKIKDWLSARSKERTRQAHQKAQEAEGRAEETQNEHEAEKYRAVAKVWREVAEQFRSDNEELKAKLDEFEAEAKTSAETDIESMNIDLDFTKEKSTLRLGDKVQELPALPE